MCSFDPLISCMISKFFFLCYKTSNTYWASYYLINPLTQYQRYFEEIRDSVMSRAMQNWNFRIFRLLSNRKWRKRTHLYFRYLIIAADKFKNFNASRPLRDTGLQLNFLTTHTYVVGSKRVNIMTKNFFNDIMLIVFRYFLDIFYQLE